MSDQLTTRRRAGALLSGRKMRELEDAGITVVDKARLDALEWLYRAEKDAKFSQIQHAMLALEATTDDQTSVSETTD